jgi:hypothetical protein
MATSTPNQTIRSGPKKASAIGVSRGTTTNVISMKSMKKPSRKITSIVKKRKPTWPPGRFRRKSCTMRSPWSAVNTIPNAVAPMRMTNTMLVSRTVWSIVACRLRRFSRRLTAARAIAPTAPIAPASVGVATPRKIVPSTRKIRTSGGIRLRSTARPRRQPWRVRASGGRAGAFAGQTIGDDDDPEHEEAGQHDPGDDRPEEEVADRHPDLVAEDHQDDRRRDDLAQRARGGDHPRGERLVVAVLQHDRQREDAHRDDRRPDDPGRRREQRAHRDHRDRQAAPQRPEEHAHRLEQLLGQARLLEHDPHEDEERDGHEGVVVHDRPEDPLREDVEPGEAELGVPGEVEAPEHAGQVAADQREEDGGPAEREGDREADEQEPDRGGEHRQAEHQGTAPAVVGAAPGGAATGGPAASSAA